MAMVDAWYDKYNEGNDRIHINLILYNEFIKHLIKILRAINIYDGHLVTVGLRGFGITTLIKLATFILQHHHRQMELHPTFTDDEWKVEVRANIAYCI